MFRLLFASPEDPLFVAPDALVSIQAFQHKLSGRHLDLWSVLGTNANLDQLFQQTEIPGTSVRQESPTSVESV